MIIIHETSGIVAKIMKSLNSIKVTAIVTITYTNRIVCYFQIQSKVSITRIVLFFKVPPSQVVIILSGKVVTIMVHWFTFQNKRSRRYPSPITARCTGVQY